MHSAALALGWELWARHRWGWSAIAAGAAAAAVLVRVLPADAARMVAAVAMPLSLFVFLYLVSIFVYAESTLGGKATGFPPRLFTLPVRTSLLVGWPMLYGTATVALLGLWLSWLVLAPSGRTLTGDWWPALFLPALFLAAYLACSQAICWTLVRAPLLRLVVVILGLPCVAMGAMLVWAMYNLEVTRTQVTVGLVAIIAASYAVAVAGVSRDRRGAGFGWAWLGRLLVRAVPRLPGQERPFASAASAQRWLEVRRHAWVLPLFVGSFVVLLFWAMALPLGPQDVARVVAAIVGVPILLAFFVGFGMGKSSFWARDLRLSSFTATRPLTSAALARAKLHAAGLSAVATWGLVLLLSPLWVVLSGNVAVVQALGEALFHDQPAWKLGLLAPLALVGLVGLTWLQLVAGMCLGLTGRAWVVNGVVLLYGAVGTALAGLGHWTGLHPDFFDTLLIVLWALGGVLCLLKLSAAAWTWSHKGCGQDRTGARLGVWLGIAACLLVPLYAVVPENPVPTHLIALFVVLALPLTRLTGLSVAVAWNRHR
jgi:hypothetical protein